ncbi:protein SlyX [Alishewanella longhuensis]
MNNETSDIQLHLIELESKIAFQEDTVNSFYIRIIGPSKTY